MKVFINGELYDSNKTPMVISLNHEERIHIAQMDPRVKYYGSFPNKLSRQMCRDILTKAREKDEKHEGTDSV